MGHLSQFMFIFIFTWFIANLTTRYRLHSCCSIAYSLDKTYKRTQSSCEGIFSEALLLVKEMSPTNEKNNNTHIHKRRAGEFKVPNHKMPHLPWQPLWWWWHTSWQWRSTWWRRRHLAWGLFVAAHVIVSATTNESRLCSRPPLIPIREICYEVVGHSQGSLWWNTAARNHLSLSATASTSVSKWEWEFMTLCGRYYKCQASPPQEMVHPRWQLW